MINFGLFSKYRHEWISPYQLAQSVDRAIHERGYIRSRDARIMATREFTGLPINSYRDLSPQACAALNAALKVGLWWDEFMEAYEKYGGRKRRDEVAAVEPAGVLQLS